MKPATPLPWTNEQIGVTSAGPDGLEVFDIGPMNRDCEMLVRVAEVTGEANAEYIVYACNAYPKLVEALRDLCESETRPTENQRAEARELLRELGELK